ncbi:MAG: YgfZ/GcvT domain-containing protein [Rhodoferax sp.]
MQSKLDGVVPLAHLGVIRAEGTDAAHFLQGQLTQDFLQLGPDQARLAAYCSAQGRMLASFYGIRHGATDILLVCSRDILGATLKNLARFVLRAKVRLTDASDDCALFGLAGETLECFFAGAPAAWSRADSGDASLISLYPADGVRRALWLAPAAQTAPAGPALNLQDWLWSEVRAGVAMITAPVVQAFVPQMLNYESVGGVNFRKGCYPGQEVVARSQFRGTLKRRAFAAHALAAMKAGDEVFQQADPEQPCGIVAQAAASPSGGYDAIVSMQISAAESGGLHLGSATGPTLVVGPAPYPLLADI